MFVRRPRPLALRPFVRSLWALDDARADVTGDARERVFPTSARQIVVRMSDGPLVVFDDERTGVVPGTPIVLAHAVASGPRASAYVRAAAAHLKAVGAELEPGGGPVLLRVAAPEIAGRH